jgi:rubrerythrin
MPLDNPHDVLESALAKEKAAFRFYDRIAQSAVNRDLQTLALQLKDEEAKHVRMIERLLARMELG